MRVLKFIVSGQSIRQEPSCDFSGLVPGTKGYLRAEFVFDHNWAGCRKVAVFTSLCKDHPAPIIKNACEIPEEALTRKNFQVSVVGERDGYRIQTNKTEVKQDG